MTSYVVEQLRCRRCQGVFVHAETASHNTFDADFFTDGYIDGPMYDPGSALVGCPHCEVFAWRDTFEYVPSESDVDSSEDLADNGLPWARPVTGVVYQAAVDASLARAPDEEIYLRKQTWWHGNNRRRLSYGNPKPLTEIEQRNLLRLLELIPSVEADDRILRAEVSRELGDFDACLGELAGIDSEGYGHAVQVISNLAKAKQPYVARIPRDGERDPSHSFE